VPHPKNNMILSKILLDPKTILHYIVSMDKKTTQIGPVRMSEAEKDLIEQAADSKELKMGAFVRQAAVKAAKTALEKAKGKK
jgi:uncharacterized protein (DUF1778 family)